MYKCSDVISGSPTFTIHTERLAEGGYKAWGPTVEQVPAVEDAEEIPASSFLLFNVTG